MNKKIMAIIIALLSGGSIITVGVAQNTGPFEILESHMPEIYPDPVPPYPSIKFTEGVAYNKETHGSKQVVFLVMKYGEEKNIYLIIEDETYKLTEITNETYDLGYGTRVYKYKAEDGSILTILTQRFERWSQISVSGDFKDYLITFKPIYYYGYPRTTETYGGGEGVVIHPGAGKVEKHLRKEFIEETRPVMKGLRKIAEGVNATQARPMQEWIG